MELDAPIVFDDSLARRFDTALNAAIPGFSGQMNAGLASEEIDALVGELPGELPDEARAWWGWQNGIADPGSGDELREDRLGRGEFGFSSLEACVRTYREMRDEALTAVGSEPEQIAPRLLFPIDESALVSIRLPETRSELAEVIATDPDGPGEFGAPLATSLGAFVTWWIESLEGGGLHWSDDQGWEANKDLVRPELIYWELA